jgi:formate--tetrahydrofolate ligase
MAKTQYSFSIEPLLLGAPTGHHVPIGEVRPGGVKGGVASLEGIRAIEEQHVQVDIERQPR